MDACCGEGNYGLGRTIEFCVVDVVEYSFLLSLELHMLRIILRIASAYSDNVATNFLLLVPPYKKFSLLYVFTSRLIYAIPFLFFLLFSLLCEHLRKCGKKICPRARLCF